MAARPGRADLSRPGLIRIEEDAGPTQVLDLRTFNWPLTLFSLVFFGAAGFFWLSHTLGSTRASPLFFAWVFGVGGVISLAYSLLPLSLRADETGLEWRQASPKRSVAWSEIEGFGVWRDRSMDEWNAHPVVRLTRSRSPTPTARLMIRLTPEARAGRNTQGLYKRSGADYALVLPVRMSLTQLETELERRLAAARSAA